MSQSILCVCLGNICRSPLAQGILEEQLRLRGLEQQYLVDSCGTGDWHVGNKPHNDSIRVARDRGIDITHQRARQVASNDVDTFDYILAMDQQNKADLISLFGKQDKILLLRDYDPTPDSRDVPDPYFGGPDGFPIVFDIIWRSSERFLEEIL